MRLRKLCLRLMLVAIVAMVTVSQNAAAYSVYGPGTLYAYPNSTEAYIGQNSLYANSSIVSAITNVGSWRKINGSWQLYPVPPGCLGCRSRFLYNLSLKGDYSNWNINEEASYRAYSYKEENGISGVIYAALGEGYAYNLSNGDYMRGEIGGTPAYVFPSSNASSEDGGSLSMLPETGNLRNGETYGYLTDASNSQQLDWISAYATNENRGYIDADDYWVPMPKNPMDAVENFSKMRVRSIPVYDEPGGSQVIGYFDMYYGGMPDDLPFEIDLQYMQHD